MKALFKKTLTSLFIAGLSFSVVSADHHELSLEDLLNTSSELKADVGSRTGAANFLASRSPVDVITFDQIERSGYTTLSDVLRYFVAGFNAPETAINDGSDHVRGFTLRGMGSDQILVLINGKRLHTSALLHVNSTVARGSSNVDLDTIPINAIEKIEILRDGAAAQYGSDAISGVINIILKGIGHADTVNLHAGQRKKGDGEKLYVDYFGSKALKYDGFVNLAISAQSQQKTQRAGLDKRYDGLPYERKTEDGIPHAQNLNLMLNADAPQAQGHEFYTKLQVSQRESKAGAFFRIPDDQRPIFPEGFLPKIQADILDYSILLGVRDRTSYGIEWDLSNSYGYNKIDYSLHNSMNYGMGINSPTRFKNGALIFSQNTTNLDLKKSLGRLDISGGVENRIENYQIKAGDNASVNQSGTSQGFAGIHPNNEIDNSRDSQAVYTNLVLQASDVWSIEGALRFENFSDFGSTTNYKLSTGYYPISELLLRSAYSTGFRAPSLTQSSYSKTSTFLTDEGNLTTQGTFIPSHEVARALGASDLKPELSDHFTLGMVFQPTTKTYLMIDYFYTQVKDRIMLSGNLTGANDQQIAVLATNNVTGARFFTNAIDTETQGIDIKLNHQFEFTNKGNLKSGIWFNYSENKITSFNGDIVTRDNSLFELSRIEKGQPQSALRLLNSYQLKKVTTTLNITRHGSYQQVLSDKAYTFDSRWLVDLDIAFKLRKNLLLSIGSHNLLDSYPNEWKNLTNNSFYGQDGFLKYSRYSPFGYSGAYYYANASLHF
jgi:iron complex outermembrane receptor protein